MRTKEKTADETEADERRPLAPPTQTTPPPFSVETTPPTTKIMMGEGVEEAATTPASTVGLASMRNGGLFKSRRRPFGSRRIRNRLVEKHGLCNVSLVNVPKQRRKFFNDIFTTVVEIKWRWSLFVFALSFCLSWSIFTGIYYLICKTHGDFVRLSEADWTPCIANVRRPSDVFIFSVVSQTTIGYGFRYPTGECPLVVVTLCVQFLVGLMTQTLMAGVIFAKLARPIKRAATIVFSKNAVICMRDGRLCLLFRVGDMRKSSLAEAHVRLQLIKKCVTFEGEVLPFHQFDLDVGFGSGLDRVFVVWPITICHEIDEDSPLYELSRDDLVNARFEIIAILEGVVESVGSTTQARTSYLPNEILWGKRFDKLVTYQRDNGEYRIDFGKFHNVLDVETPRCSAKRLDELRAEGFTTDDVMEMERRDVNGTFAGLGPPTRLQSSMTRFSQSSLVPAAAETSGSQQAIVLPQTRSRAVSTASAGLFLTAGVPLIQLPDDRHQDNISQCSETALLMEAAPSGLVVSGGQAIVAVDSDEEEFLQQTDGTDHPHLELVDVGARQRKKSTRSTSPQDAVFAGGGGTSSQNLNAMAQATGGGNKNVANAQQQPKTSSGSHHHYTHKLSSAARRGPDIF